LVESWVKHLWYVNSFYKWLAEFSSKFEVFSFYSERARGSVECFYAKGDANKPLVVVLHSTGCEKYTPLLNLYRRLTLEGYSVFAFDLDGHGRDSTHVFQTSHLLDDGVKKMMEEALDHLAKYFAWENLYIVGQSLGGCLGIEYSSLLDAKYKPEKLVCIGTPITISLNKVSVLKELTSVGQWSVLKALGTYGLSGTIPALKTFRRSVFPMRYINESADGTSHIYDVVDLINGLNLAQKCKDIEIPTLWVQGGLDTIAQSRPGIPRLKRLNLPRECHFSLLFAEQYFDDLVDFFQKPQ